MYHTLNKGLQERTEHEHCGQDNSDSGRQDDFLVRRVNVIT